MLSCSHSTSAYKISSSPGLKGGLVRIEEISSFFHVHKSSITIHYSSSYSTLPTTSVVGASTTCGSYFGCFDCACVLFGLHSSALGPESADFGLSMDWAHGAMFMWSKWVKWPKCQSLGCSSSGIASRMSRMTKAQEPFYYHLLIIYQ